MKIGDIVIVVGKTDEKIRVQPKGFEGCVLGTYIGNISDKRVCVLLPDGAIFVGHDYEIVKYEAIG
jgi:hypothetical protein